MQANQVLMAPLSNPFAYGSGGNAQNSTTAAYLDRTRADHDTKVNQNPPSYGFCCPVCRGIGHEYWQCPTKKTLDKWAAKNNDVANWGQWKYDTYYGMIDEVTRQKHKMMAKKAN